MANFVLKELPEWMGDGKKGVYTMTDLMKF
jgi:hypothetical protein